MKEWRVVSKSVRGSFRVFSTNESIARDFLENGALANDPNGKYALQSRPHGITGDDSTWTDELEKP